MKYSDHTRNVINKSISLDLKCQRFLIYAKRVDISTMQKCQFSYFTICFCYSPSVIIAHTTYFKQTTSQSFCSQLNLKKKKKSGLWDLKQTQSLNLLYSRAAKWYSFGILSLGGNVFTGWGLRLGRDLSLQGPFSVAARRLVDVGNLLDCLFHTSKETGLQCRCKMM